MSILDKAADAKNASIQLAAVPTHIKNSALKAIARALEEKKDQIISANQADLSNAAKDNLAAPLLKRLKFQEDKITEAIEGLNSVIRLEDPVGVTSGALGPDHRG